MPSPFDGLELPEPVPFRAAVLESIEEIRLFVDLAYRVDPGWADLVVTASCTGFRFGEVTARGPESLDPVRGDVTVVRRFSGGRLLPGTKSGRGGTRPVLVPGPVMAMLTDRVQDVAAGVMLFATATGGRWPFSSYWKRWNRLRELLRGQVSTGISPATDYDTASSAPCTPVTPETPSCAASPGTATPAPPTTTTTSPHPAGQRSPPSSTRSSSGRRLTVTSTTSGPKLGLFFPR
jgi:hypothetical protein